MKYLFLELSPLFPQIIVQFGELSQKSVVRTNVAVFATLKKKIRISTWIVQDLTSISASTAVMFCLSMR